MSRDETDGGCERLTGVMRDKVGMCRDSGAIAMKVERVTCMFRGHTVVGKT